MIAVGFQDTGLLVLSLHQALAAWTRAKANADDSAGWPGDENVMRIMELAEDLIGGLLPDADPAHLSVMVKTSEDLRELLKLLIPSEPTYPN